MQSGVIFQATAVHNGLKGWASKERAWWGRGGSCHNATIVQCSHAITQSFNKRICRNAFKEDFLPATHEPVPILSQGPCSVRECLRDNRAVCQTKLGQSIMLSATRVCAVAHKE
jgi:hypothetical protein